MRMSRRSILCGIVGGGFLSVTAVSTAAHTAADLSSISWDDLKIYADLIAGDTAHTYTNDTKSVTFSDGQTLGIGDVKSVVLNGTVGYLTFSNTTSYCFILGFRHNFSVEGTGIHFQFGKTGLGGTDVAFVDSRYDVKGSTPAFRFNTTESVSGGWDSSYMYGTIIPAFYNAVPSELQSVVATMIKYTDNVGSGIDNPTSVTSVSEKFTLAAEFEIFGVRSSANSAEQNYQQQYAYYAAGNSKVKRKHDSTGTTCHWYLRSINAITTTRTRIVTNTGASSQNDPRSSQGFAPIFSIGSAA